MIKKKVTAEDVRWAYRLMLSREPENFDIILEGIKNFASVDELVDTIQASEEYRGRRGL